MMNLREEAKSNSAKINKTASRAWFCFQELHQFGCCFRGSSSGSLISFPGTIVSCFVTKDEKGSKRMSSLDHFVINSKMTLVNPDVTPVTTVRINPVCICLKMMHHSIIGFHVKDTVLIKFLSLRLLIDDRAGSTEPRLESQSAAWFSPLQSNLRERWIRIYKFVWCPKKSIYWCLEQKLMTSTEGNRYNLVKDRKTVLTPPANYVFRCQCHLILQFIHPSSVQWGLYKWVIFLLTVKSSDFSSGSIFVIV